MKENKDQVLHITFTLSRILLKTISILKQENMIHNQDNKQSTETEADMTDENSRQRCLKGF